MLVLSRYVNEKIILRPTGPAVVTIQLQSVRGERAVFGIEAPQSVRIDRAEVDKERNPELTADPPPASGMVEGLMRDRGLPESDRFEVRMMAEFIRLRKDKKPLTPELRAWILGPEEVTRAK